jgi:hypothetical protein
MAFLQADSLQSPSSRSSQEIQAESHAQEKSITVTGSSENVTQSRKEGPQDISEDETITAKHDFSFYMIMFSLAVVVFFSAMDATIIVTAFPTISHELHGGDKYVWIANASSLPQRLSSRSSVSWQTSSGVAIPC